MNVDSVKSDVFMYLVRFPETRDDDMVLLSKIWESYCENDSSESIFFQIRRRLLPHFETIRRMRQKIQQHYPELRGKKYKERQEKGKKFPTFLEKIFS